MSISIRTLALAAAGALSLAAVGASASPSEIREIRCDTLEMDNGRLQTVQALDLHVLRDTARNGRFAPRLDQSVVSIMCSRNDILPAANDDEVVWLGMPLHIAEMGSPGRLGVLEITEGQYRFRMLEGRLRAEEEQPLAARLAEFQSRFPPTN